MKRLFNKRGNISVMGSILFSALIVMVVVLVAAAKQTAGESYADAAFQLAGRSILSEYDNMLFREFGLIAFKGDEKKIEDDLQFYAGASLNSDLFIYIPFVASTDNITFFDIETTFNANLKEFSLGNLEVFQDQVKNAIGKNVHKVIGSEATDNDYVIRDMEEGDSPNDRTLRNESVIESLPSYDFDTSFTLPSFKNIRIPSIEDITDATSDKFFASEYIMAFFSHANDNKYPKDRFFDNEIEYILAGEMNDKKNYKEVKGLIRIIRVASNSIALLSDRDKRNRIRAIVNAAPHPALKGIFAATLPTAWIIAETKNDMKRIEAGEKVPFIKSKDQWATDNIEEISEGFSSEEIVHPENLSGQDYREYLRLLVYLHDKEKLMVRTMDLIQIHMIHTYNRNFLLRDYYAGFRFEATMKGKKYAYLQKY